MDDAAGSGKNRATYRKLRPGPGRSRRDVAIHQQGRLQAAMVDLVAERGYNAVTVNELALRAGVSKRDFYRHFEGKEACFVATYDLIVRRAVQGILSAVEGEADWGERLLLGFCAFAQKIVENPAAARLTLVEAFDAGPKALERMQRADGLFEALVAKNFAAAPGGGSLPPLVVKGIVAGGTRVARVRLLAGEEKELEFDGQELMEWAVSFCDDAAARLADLGAVTPTCPITTSEEELRQPADERTLILAAAARLSVQEGFHALNVPRVRAAAGVSRKSFDSHFEGVTDCFLAAVDLIGRRALAAATSACDDEDEWAAGVHQVIAALCARIAGDPMLAKLAFLEVFAPGPEAIRWRGELTTRLGELLCQGAPPDQRPTPFAAEASVGAVWGVIHHFIATGHAARLPAAAATLSYLALAPGIGGAQAFEAIERATTDAARAAKVPARKRPVQLPIKFVR